MNSAYAPAPSMRLEYRRPEASGIIGRTAAAFMGCSLLAMALVSTDDQLLHWFVIPVVLCGALIGSDAVAFVQGRLELIDPAAIVGLLGIHFFFLAPLLHVIWDFWTPYIVGPPEWRDWLGWMAMLNLLGLVLYRWVLLTGSVQRRPVIPAKPWRIDNRRAVFAMGALLLITGLAQVWVYIHYGGISGYMAAYLDGEHHYGNKDPNIGFNGMGWVFTISESFPIIALFAFVLYLRKSEKQPSWVALFAILAVYFVLVMLFGGLRGSRSNTIWALFWAVGVIHFFVRKVTRGFILVGVLFLMCFMYMYGFYKSVGTEALDAFDSSDTRESLSRKTGRTFAGSILGDLGRSDIQALLLYKMTAPPVTYEYAWGRTYLGAASLLIPRSVWPNRPPTKTRWITELESGPGSWTPELWESSHVAGLAGEAMLNFGPAAAPISYLVLGLLVLRIRAWLRRLAPDDSRWLMAPFLIMLTFIVMAGDSDNDIFFVFKSACLPLLAVMLSSRRNQPLSEGRLL